MLTEITSSHTDSDKLRMRNEVRQQLFRKLADKEYRDIFVDEQINTGLAFQIRGLREQRNWSQAELGKRAGMAQSRISVMEDANYSRFSLSTLKRLASAFDVGLTVKFSPYGKLVEDFIALDSSALNMPGFTEDSPVAEAAPFQTQSLLNSILVTHYSEKATSAVSEGYKLLGDNTTSVSVSLTPSLPPFNVVDETMLTSNIAQPRVA